MNQLSLRLGTRASALARWQANHVAERLHATGAAVELIEIATAGDVTAGSLQAGGGVGLFTKELQRALLDGRIDLAVHSLKDLPTEPVAGLVLAAVPEREDPRDALVSRVAKSLDELPRNARVGTGSVRRAAQLRHLRPDLQIEDIRGNLDTRLAKLDRGDYDAIILAAAGLRRLGWQDRIAQILSPAEMLPAVGQGALGVECRAADAATQNALGSLNHFESHAAVLAERSLLFTLRAGCLAPVGAWARTIAPNRLRLDATVLAADGSLRIAVRDEGAIDEAAALGERLAERLLVAGAAKLIAAARG